MENANDDAPRGVECDVIEDRDRDDVWLVEAIDHGSEGEIYCASFYGPLARERALAYAASEYGHKGIVMPRLPPSQPGLTVHRKPRPKLTLVPSPPQNTEA